MAFRITRLRRARGDHEDIFRATVAYHRAAVDPRSGISPGPEQPDAQTGANAYSRAREFSPSRRPVAAGAAATSNANANAARDPDAPDHATTGHTNGPGATPCRDTHAACDSGCPARCHAAARYAPKRNTPRRNTHAAGCPDADRAIDAAARADPGATGCGGAAAANLAFAGGDFDAGAGNIGLCRTAAQQCALVHSRRGRIAPACRVRMVCRDVPASPP